MLKESSAELVKYSVNNTENGKGLFASEDISKGDALLKIGGKSVNYKDTLTLDDESYCLQIDLNTYIVPHYPFFFINHSCEPNCGINEKLELIAITDMKKGTELTWDYSTSILERDWQIACNCNTKSCRKRITDFDQLPLHVQKKYLSLGIVMPFITRFFELIKKL